MDCAIPITGSSSSAATSIKLAHAIPGAILSPSPFLDDVEVWTPGEARQIAWLYYKGALAERVGENARENAVKCGSLAPFKDDTAFRIDLLRTGESVLREVMEPTTIQPFISSSEHSSSNDDSHTFTHIPLLNTSCTPNAYSTLSYKWIVPAGLDTKPTYHLQLSTNDSDFLHFSGAFKISAGGKGSGCRGSGRIASWAAYKAREEGLASDQVWLLLGLLAMGVLVVSHFVTKHRARRSFYTAVAMDDTERDEKEEVVWVIDIKDEEE